MIRALALLLALAPALARGQSVTPASGIPLTGNASFPTTGLVTFGTGTLHGGFDTFVPRWVAVYDGTIEAPITTAGATMRIDRRENISDPAVCNNNPLGETECNAGLAIDTRGGLDEIQVVSGLFVQAQGALTGTFSAGAGTANVQAANLIANVGVGSGGAQAIYAQGQRDTIAGRIVAVELRVFNNAPGACGDPNTTGTTVLGCDAMWIGVDASDPTFYGSSAFHIHDHYGVAFKEGMTWNAGSILNKTFHDASSSLISLEIDGTHTYGIGLAATAGGIGVGTITPTAKLDMEGGFSAAAWGTSGVGLRASAQTYTDTTSSGSVAGTTAVYSFLAPTIAASSATTYATAATVYIGGPPVAGTNVTLSGTSTLVVNGFTDVVGTLQTRAATKFIGIGSASSGTVMLCIDGSGNVLKGTNTTCPL